MEEGIQWSSSNNTGGVNGARACFTQVGFNGGDKAHYYERPEVKNGLILHLDNNSNLCVPGKYVFRIDGENITEGSCIRFEPGKIQVYHE